VIPVLGPEPLLEALESLPQVVPFLLQLFGTRGEVRIGLPPVDPDLLRLVDRGDQQTDLQREHLDGAQREADVTGNDDAFVEDSLEEVCEVRGLGRADGRPGDTACRGSPSFMLDPSTDAPTPPPSCCPCPSARLRLLQEVSERTKIQAEIAVLQAEESLQLVHFSLKA
jgi:hypothetical protein